MPEWRDEPRHRRHRAARPRARRALGGARAGGRERRGMARVPRALHAQPAHDARLARRVPRDRNRGGGRPVARLGTLPLSPGQHPALRPARPRAALLPRDRAREARAGARRVVDRAPRVAARCAARLERARYVRAAALRVLPRVRVALAFAQPLRDHVRALARDGALRHVARQLDLEPARAGAGMERGESAARGRRVLLRARPAGGRFRTLWERSLGRPTPAGERTAQPPARPGWKPNVASHHAATRSACSSSR